MRKLLSGRSKWFALAFLILLTVIQTGGDTVTILNRTGTPICGVYFAYSPDDLGWGHNHLLWGNIPDRHSRDFHLPIYWEWFRDETVTGYAGHLVSCFGEELDTENGIGLEADYFLWEAR